MRKPLTHTLRTIMLLLLSVMTIAANAVCPAGTRLYEVQFYGQCESDSIANAISLNAENEVEMVVECTPVEGIYDADWQGDNCKEDKEEKDKWDKSGMKVSSEDLHGTYPYESAEEKTADKSVTTSNPLNEKFSVKSLILPGGLIAAGVIGMEAGLFKSRNDEKVYTEKDGVNFEDVAQYVPVGAYLTLGLIPGIEHKHSLAQRSMAAVTAYGMMFLVTKPVKHWIHERRPDRTSDDSFPSGHAATSFTGAELMRLEYGNGIGLGAYALATTVSVLRITHNRHWFNDVVAGAGIGILCARASYWLLPLERKLFGIKDPKVGVAAFPICNPQSRQFALGCCINF